MCTILARGALVNFSDNFRISYVTSPFFLSFSSSCTPTRLTKKMCLNGHTHTEETIGVALFEENAAGRHSQPSPAAVQERASFASGCSAAGLDCTTALTGSLGPTFSRNLAFVRTTHAVTISIEQTFKLHHNNSFTDTQLLHLRFSSLSFWCGCFFV